MFSFTTQYNKMCDQKDDISLETAMNQVYTRHSLAPQHDFEVDLDPLTEKELQDLVVNAKEVFLKMDSPKSEKELQDKLTSFRGIKPDAKAVRLINGIRAQLKLLQMRKFANRMRQSVGNQQDQQTQHEQAQQKPHQLQQASQQQQALAAGRKQPAASYFHAGQHGRQGAGSASRSNSARQQQALLQQAPQPTRSVTMHSKLDNVVSLAHSRAGQAGPSPAQGSDPPVGTYALYGGRQPAHSCSQQQQRSMQANVFPAGSLQQLTAGQQWQSQGRQQLNLQPTRQYVRQGGNQQQQQQHVNREMAPCTVCENKFNKVLMHEPQGSRMFVCNNCWKEQQHQVPRQALKAAPLKIAPRKPAAATAAGRAAIRREQNKKGDHDDAPIDLADDTDDEQQEQQHESSPDQEQQQAAAARTTRHRTSIVDLLADGAQGTATMFAGLQALYPAAGGKGAVSVTADDLERLDPDAFLNDTVIDYYIKRLELSLPDEVRARFHFFNSFFFKKLTEKSSAPTGASRKAADIAKRNHDRVKSWTKGIDIFSKDYLFVPIHDALHWSLVIICHPGLLEKLAAIMGWSLHPETLEAMQAAAAEAAAANAEGSQQAAAAFGGVDIDAVVDGAGNVEPSPCIIHLDSMTSGHSTTSICNALRKYLEHEWMRKVHEHKHHHGKHHKHHEQHTDQQAAAEPGSPGAQQQAPLTFDLKVLPHMRICDKLPRQDNHCDCGLFVLTYMEYFVHAAPKALNVTVLRDDKHAQVCLSPIQQQLLRKGWFEPALASCLRGHLRHQLLKLMIDQAQDKGSGAVVQAVADTQQYEEELQLQRRRLEEQQQPGEVNPIFCYLSPDQYHDPALQQLLQSYKQRQEEIRQANKRRRQQQRSATGAEGQRQQSISKYGSLSMHADDAAVGGAGSDEDWEPGAKRGGKKSGRRRSQPVHSPLSSDDDTDKPQQQGTGPANSKPRFIGPQLPKEAVAAAAARGGKGRFSVADIADDDDDFEDRQPSRRAAVAAATAAGAKPQQKKPPLLRDNFDLQHALLNIQVQGGESDEPDNSWEAMQVDGQQQEQGQQPVPSAGQKRLQGPSPDAPSAKAARSGGPPTDDAGASAETSSSSGSQGFVTAPDDDDPTSSGPEDGQQQLEQHQDLEQLLPKSLDQQLPELMQDMSIAAQQPLQAAAATPGRRRTRQQAAAAAGDGKAHEQVDLCSEDGDDQQQAEAGEQAEPSTKRHSYQATEQQTDEQQQQQESELWKEACDLVNCHFEHDPQSIYMLQTFLDQEFPHCQDLAAELAIAGAVKEEDQQAIQEMIQKELELHKKPRRELLPDLLRAIQIASNKQDQLNGSREQWAFLKSSNQQQQQQQPGSRKKSRGGSASRRAQKGAAPAADDKQLKLTDAPGFGVQAPGRTVDEDQVHAKLQQRMVEEQQLEEADALAALSAGDNSGGDGGPLLTLRLDTSQQQDGLTDLQQPVDLVSDSDSEVVENEQPDQRQTAAPQRPLAANPWSAASNQAHRLQGLATAASLHVQQQQLPGSGLQQTHQRRRQIQPNTIQAIQASVFAEVTGAAAPGAAAKAAAARTGSDASFVSADEGQAGHLVQHDEQHQVVPEAGVQTPGGRRQRKQQQQQQPQKLAATPSMCVGSFVAAFKNPWPAAGVQAQQPPAPLPQDVRPDYSSTSSTRREESDVTDIQGQPANEVVSPGPQQRQQQQQVKPASAAAAPAVKATLHTPGNAAALTAQAAALLQDMPRSRQHQQQQQQAMGLHTSPVKGSRPAGAASAAALLEKPTQQPRTRSKKSCGEQATRVDDGPSQVSVVVSD